MSRTFQAIIWDFGGVFTSSPFEAFNHYEAEKGLPRDLIRTVNATNPDTNAWALFERTFFAAPSMATTRLRPAMPSLAAA